MVYIGPRGRRGGSKGFSRSFSWAIPGPLRGGFPDFAVLQNRKKSAARMPSTNPPQLQYFGGRRLRRGLSVIVEDDVVSRKARLWPWGLEAETT